MLIRILWNCDLQKQFLVGLVVGLSAGIVAGLSAGLVVGLVAGLSAGIVAGLSAGIVAGLSAGLVVGLGEGLIVGEYGLTWWIVLGMFCLISELLYFIDVKHGNKPIKTLRQVVLRKLDSFFTVNLIGINILNLWWVYPNIVLQWFGYIGIAFLVFLLLIGIAYLNKIIGNSIVIKTEKKINPAKAGVQTNSKK